MYHNEDSRHSHSCSDHRLLAAVRRSRTDSLVDTMAFSHLPLDMLLLLYVMYSVFTYTRIDIRSAIKFTL